MKPSSPSAPAPDDSVLWQLEDTDELVEIVADGDVVDSMDVVARVTVIEPTEVIQANQAMTIVATPVEDTGPWALHRFVMQEPLDVHGRSRAHVALGDRRPGESAFVDAVMGLQRVATFFAPYRFVILAFVILGIAAGAASALLLPPKAVAVFDVRLQSAPSVNPLERATMSLDFFRSASTTFRSAGAVHRTLAALGEGAPTSARVEEIQSALTFERTGDERSDTYAGRFSAADDAWSVKFLQTHVDGYLTAEIEKTLGVIGARVDFLDGQLGATEQDLRKTEADLLAFKTHNADGLPDQAKQYYDHQFALQKRESALAAEVSRHDAEAAVGARRMQGEGALVESHSAAKRPYQLAIVDANRQLADAHAAGLSDGHPDVRTLKAKLVELRRLATEAEHSGDDVNIERSRNPIFDATNDRVQRSRASASASRSERARLHEDQARIQAIVAKLPALEAEHAELMRSYQATQQLHTRLFDQHRTTSIQYALEKASSAARFEIISAPHIEYAGSPSELVVRRSGLFAIAGLFAGIALAVLFRVRGALGALGAFGPVSATAPGRRSR